MTDQIDDPSSESLATTTTSDDHDVTHAHVHAHGRGIDTRHWTPSDAAAYHAEHLAPLIRSGVLVVNGLSETETQRADANESLMRDLARQRDSLIRVRDDLIATLHDERVKSDRFQAMRKSLGSLYFALRRIEAACVRETGIFAEFVQGVSQSAIASIADPDPGWCHDAERQGTSDSADASRSSVLWGLREDGWWGVEMRNGEPFRARRNGKVIVAHRDTFSQWSRSSPQHQSDTAAPEWMPGDLSEWNGYTLVVDLCSEGIVALRRLDRTVYRAVHVDILRRPAFAVPMRVREVHGTKRRGIVDGIDQIGDDTVITFALDDGDTHSCTWDDAPAEFVPVAPSESDGGSP